MIVPDVLERLSRAIYTRKEMHAIPYHLFLTRDRSERSGGSGDRALAHLLCAGYFSTIVTAHPEGALELALEELGAQPFVYTIGQTPDERVAETLEVTKSGIHLVRLYTQPAGSEQTIPTGLLSSDIQSSLQHYFNEELIIVGSLEREADEVVALLAQKQGGLYYVHPRAVSPDDRAVAYLREQESQIEPDEFLITGPDGEFDRFFRLLEQRIREHASRAPDPHVPSAHTPDSQTGSQTSIQVPERATTSGQFSPVQPPVLVPGVKPSASLPIELFYVFAPEDKALQQRIDGHLASLYYTGQRLLRTWHPGQTVAGAEAELEFKQHWEVAHIILLLVSSDFFSTPGLTEIAAKALERHNSGSAVVIPIILRPVLWQQASFGKLQALPRDLRPVTVWSNLDEALFHIAQELFQIIDQLLKKS